MKKKLRFPLWAKTFLALALSVAVVSVVAVSISSYTLRNTTRNHYIERSIEIADTLGVYLDLDDVKKLRQDVEAIYKGIPEDEKVENSEWGSDEWKNYVARYEEILETPEYKNIMSQLETFHSKNDAKYTYLGYADFTNQRLVYLADDSDPEERCLPGMYDDFTEQDMSVIDHMDTGFEPEISNMPEYGYLASVGRPIFDETHNIVAYSLVDLSMDAIVAKENQETLTLSIILISIGVGAIVIAYLLVLYLVIRPVRKLTKVANDYTNGSDESLDKFSKVNINTRDEIEDLSNSMKKMEEDINRYIQDLLGAEMKANELKSLADKDAMTGVGNKRAYFEAEERLNSLISKKKANFAISMIDLNDLKITNDTLGHEKGDASIKTLVGIIKDVYANSAVYRIGGDEFTVITEDKLVQVVDKLEEEFNTEIAKEPSISAAIGTAIFDPANDNNVEDTFKRADSKMYQCKKAMKAKK